jgi:hypothetical protein
MRGPSTPHAALSSSREELMQARSSGARAEQCPALRRAGAVGMSIWVHAAALGKRKVLKTG